MKSGKRVAILQSNYIPWKGYFDLLNLVDEFILYDDVQFSKGGWRNRNRVKTQHKVSWLTVPVKVSGRFGQTIRNTEVSDSEWPRTHWQTIQQSYARAPWFPQYRPLIEDVYKDCRFVYLSDVNRCFIEAMCGILGITTTITSSADYEMVGDRNARLVRLCQQAGASEYVSGPSAGNYLDEGLFKDAGIAVTYVDYLNYREYPQLHPPFEHAVSIVDLIFNTGPLAPLYMKSFAGTV